MLITEAELNTLLGTGYSWTGSALIEPIAAFALVARPPKPDDEILLIIPEIDPDKETRVGISDIYLFVGTHPEIRAVLYEHQLGLPYGRITPGRVTAKQIVSTSRQSTITVINQGGGGGDN